MRGKYTIVEVRPQLLAPAARPQGADLARMDRPRELGRFSGSARGFLRITPWGNTRREAATSPPMPFRRFASIGMRDQADYQEPNVWMLHCLQPPLGRRAPSLRDGRRRAPRDRSV